MDDLDIKLNEIKHKMDGLNCFLPRTNIPMPEKFDGSKSFSEYLRDFNRAATAHGWDPARCTQIFPVFLINDAKTVYDSLQTNEKNSWDNLLKSMARGLSKLTGKERARRQIAHRKQNKDESLNQYALALKDLVVKAFPDIPGAVGTNADEQEKALRKFQDQVARDYFRAGVHHDIKEKLLFMVTKDSLQETVLQAKGIQEIFHDLKQESVFGIEKEMLDNVKADVFALRKMIENRNSESPESQNADYENQYFYTIFDFSLHRKWLFLIFASYFSRCLCLCSSTRPCHIAMPQSTEQLDFDINFDHNFIELYCTIIRLNVIK
jgi:hypothetical protein